VTEGHAHTGRGRTLVTAGVVLVAAAIVLIGVRAYQAAQAKDRSAQLCRSLTAKLDQVVGEAAEQDTSPALNAAHMPVLQLEGVDVIARLQIETLGLDVPVAAEGSDAALTPARVMRPDGDESKLEVAGATYQDEGAWGRIGDLTGGETVALTSVTGARQEYVVVSAGRTSAEFDDNFDLLVYYADGFGEKTWVGCTKSS